MKGRLEIQKLGDEYQISARYLTSGGKVRRTARVAKDKAAAKRIVRELLDEIENPAEPSQLSM